MAFMKLCHVVAERAFSDFLRLAPGFGRAAEWNRSRTLPPETLRQTWPSRGRYHATGTDQERDIDSRGRKLMVLAQDDNGEWHIRSISSS